MVTESPHFSNEDLKQHIYKSHQETKEVDKTHSHISKWSLCWLLVLENKTSEFTDSSQVDEAKDGGKKLKKTRLSVIKTSVDKHFSTKEFLRYSRDRDEIEFTTESKKGVKNHRVLTFEEGKLWFKLKPESPINVHNDKEKKEF